MVKRSPFCSTFIQMTKAVPPLAENVFMYSRSAMLWIRSWSRKCVFSAFKVNTKIKSLSNVPLIHWPNQRHMWAGGAREPNQWTTSTASPCLCPKCGTNVTRSWLTTHLLHPQQLSKNNKLNTTKFALTVALDKTCCLVQGNPIKWCGLKHLQR